MLKEVVKGRKNTKHTPGHTYPCHNAFGARGPSFHKRSPEHEIAICVFLPDEEVLQEKELILAKSVGEKRKTHDMACFDWALCWWEGIDWGRTEVEVLQYTV